MRTAPEPEVLDDEFLGLRRAQLQEQRKALADIAEMLSAEIDAHRRRRETGDGGSEGFGTGDTSSVDLEQVRSQLGSILAQLVYVDAALTRLSTGSFGKCERCRQPIAQDRLEAMPTATRCIVCQSRSPGS